MRAFHLEHERLMRGTFKPGSRNLCFVFQVNCPGCFVYGIPVVNQLYEKHHDRCGFIGISTVFEDFDKNIPGNTGSLLAEGRMTGETLRYYQQTGHTLYPHPVLFPVAFDKTSPSAQFLTEERVLEICRFHPNYAIWPAWEQENMRKKIVAYYVRQPVVAHTFALNQLRGTPSFVIFDAEGSVIASLFGRQPPDVIERFIVEN